MQFVCYLIVQFDTQTEICSKFVYILTVGELDAEPDQPDFSDDQGISSTAI